MKMTTKSIFCTGILIFCLVAFAFSQTEKIVPIVGAGFLLGGVENGKWFNYDKTLGQLKEKGDFVLIGLRGGDRIGKVVPGTKTDSYCPELKTVEFEEEFAGFGIGANAKWKLLPRVPKDIALTNKTYRKAARDFLKTRGIVTNQVKLTQIFRVDLDGDRQDEIVMTGNYNKLGTSAPQSVGDYSFVMVRKIVGGTPRNILIEGDFLRYQRKDSSEPPYQREVTAIADLNGDGKMEILIHWFYFGGEAATVYELRKNKFGKVFEKGCGS